jgi:hypothetical protein
VSQRAPSVAAAPMPRATSETPPLLFLRLVVGGSWVAFGLYALLSVALQYRTLLNMGGSCTCEGGDPVAFMWALRWFPYAIAHGVNPFVTHVLWTGSSGLNLAGVTSIPGVAIVAAPITLLAGPLVAFNVLQLAAPALCAWSAYRLCRYITRANGPSLVGGYLYGFSSFELGQLLGHMHLTLGFCVPLAVLVTLECYDNVITARGYVVRMALLVVAQLLISSEVLLTASVLGLIWATLAWSFAEPAQRRRVSDVFVLALGACVIAGIICSPQLYYEFKAPPNAQGVGLSADVLNLVVPTHLNLLFGGVLHGVSENFPGAISEQGSYLGLPLIVIVASYAMRLRRKDRTAELLLSLLAVTIVWSLGATLIVAGHRGIHLPWSLFHRIALLAQVLPVRIASLSALLCAIVATKWLAEPHRRPLVRWGLAGLAVLFLLPNPWVELGSGRSAYHAKPDVPRFFTSGLYRRYLRSGEIVVPLPYNEQGPSVLWQADTDMYFRMASGHFGVIPDLYADEVPIVSELRGSPFDPFVTGELRAFLATHDVGAVIIEQHQSQLSLASPARWLPVLARLGLTPITVGGVLLYQVPAAMRVPPS